MDLKESRAQSSAAEGDWYDDVRFALLQRLIGATPFSAALDFGCGSGGLAQRLASNGHTAVHGYDPALTHTEGDRLASLGVTASADLAALAPWSFDLVLLMDVLEHVDDPQALLQQACSFVAPFGTIVITVPAYRWLWSSHDVSLGHVDRYTRPRLRQLCETAGPEFVTTKSAYAFPSLFLGAAPVRTLERLRRTDKGAEEPSQMADISPGLARMLRGLGIADVQTIAARSPFGLTCVQVMRRSG